MYRIAQAIDELTNTTFEKDDLTDVTAKFSKYQASSEFGRWCRQL